MVRLCPEDEDHLQQRQLNAASQKAPGRDQTTQCDPIILSHENPREDSKEAHRIFPNNGGE